MGLFNFKRKNIQEEEFSRNIKKDIEITFTDVAQQEVIPIEKRIRGEIPTCDGLYPHEVLVLSYAPKYCSIGNEYPKFWWYSYGIKDVSVILSELKHKELIKIGDITDAVNMERLPAIKEELKRNGLKVTGKKEELVARLVENVSENELSRVFVKRPFLLTDDGEKILKKYVWIPYIHSHKIDGLDIWNLTEMVQNPPYADYRDKIWGYLNSMSMSYAGNNKWGLYSNMRRRMAEFVAEEGKFENALHIINEVVLYDLNMPVDGYMTDLLYIYVNDYFPYKSSIIRVAPGIIEQIKSYSNMLGLNKEQLYEFVLCDMKRVELPFRIFTPEESASIVLFEISEDVSALEKIYSVAEKRFRQQNTNLL